MEESIVSNLKIKALIIMLIAILILTGSAFLSKTYAADEGEKQEVAEEVKEEVEIKLNRTVKFTGNTYKSSKENAKVRNEYKEEVSGIIGMINNGKPHDIYIIGKGWISRDQVISSKKYIDVTFELTENGLNSGIKIDGEKLDVDIKNDAVLKLENGELKAGVNGTTEVIFTKKDGTELKVLEETHEGNVTFKMEEQLVTGDFKADAVVVEKVVIKADGNGEVALNADSGVIRVVANGDANMKAETVDGKEIATGTIGFKGEVAADLNEMALTASGESHQEIRTLSDKIRIALQEKANARIDTKGINVQGEAKADANEQELANVKGEVNYNYGDQDPTGSISGSILGGQPIEKSGTIPVISTIRSLLRRMPILAK